MVALAIHLLKHIESCFHYLDSAAGRHGKASLHEIVILRQVFAERIGIKEDADNGGNRPLLTQFLGTTGSVVGDVGT